MPAFTAWERRSHEFRHGGRPADAVFALAPVVPVITIEDASARGSAGACAGRRRVAGRRDYVAHSCCGRGGAGHHRGVTEAVVGIWHGADAGRHAARRRIGAAFALSPGISTELLQPRPLDMPFVPGIQTASDLIACITRGFELVKFFPAVPAGGLAALKALERAVPHRALLPDG